MIRSIADLQQMKEAYLEKMGQYSHLCMVCYGTGCMSSGCKNVRDAMVEELEKAGLTDKVAVIERGCMGTCAVGPVVYVLPDETYYTEMTPERVKDVVQKHFIGGVPFGISALANLSSRWLFAPPLTSPGMHSSTLSAWAGRWCG